ncbi:hypothetical protein NP233_g3291 [Leucocoprinus birnbaumii]|uniref:Nephrocystin 3-like N-terminal domain-containing protein n=1 Tax=Leucocoprinus birnbaumii TaxID=56174 RepID=A0AAD5YYF7_9AGAR|nr:hypothetical protein NP233_g3291 [Leucocoprinus birnbaumii]
MPKSIRLYPSLGCLFTPSPAGMFREAREVAVTGSTLINYYWGSENDTDLPTLSKESIKDALHDSRHQELVVNALRPFPDSEGAIPAISHRIFESKNQLCAVWLRDPGSNLAYLCARRLSRQLAASFFFDTKCHSDDTSKFFLTIAYQLALQFRPYDYLLRHKLRRNPDLVDKCLETQFCELIVEPFRQLQFRHVQIGERKLIVVNGIDHCQNPQDRAEILRVIGESRRELPFHWVIFSSPELTAQLEEPAVISVEGLDLCSGSYKGWKMAVAFSRVDEVWTNLPNVGQKYTFISLSIGLTASLFD